MLQEHLGLAERAICLQLGLCARLLVFHLYIAWQGSSTTLIPTVDGRGMCTHATQGIQKAECIRTASDRIMICAAHRQLGTRPKLHCCTVLPCRCRVKRTDPRQFNTPKARTQYSQHQLYKQTLHLPHGCLTYLDRPASCNDEAQHCRTTRTYIVLHTICMHACMYHTQQQLRHQAR